MSRDGVVYSIIDDEEETVRRSVARLARSNGFRAETFFYEYFHGDNGAGIGANHQTGWTGLVAGLIQFFGSVDAEQMLATGGAGAAYRPPATAPAPG